MTEAQPKQTWALTLFCIGVFMAALDNGIISAALTTINHSFDVSPNWGAWGVTIYTLGLAISVPIVGKLSDRYGRKKLFIVEIALFGLGSLLVALSPNFTFYLFSRFIQAIGGGGIFIIGSSHVLSTMPISQHGKALGMLGGMNGIGAVLGPNIGSFILDVTENWHYLFLINVPIAIALIIFGAWKIVETKEATTRKLDFFGTVLLSFAILGVMYGITNLEGTDVIESMLQPDVYGFILSGFVLFVGLIFYERNLERKGGDPILPYQLLTMTPFLLTLLIGSLSGALLASMIFIPAFSESVLGIPAETAGYWMTPLAVASGVGAALGGALVDKRGPILAVIASGVISAIGFFMFSNWVTTKLLFIVASVVAGFGIGILLGAPLNVLATEKTKTAKGSALATLSLTRQIGMTIAPTIYAGFITRAYNNIPNLMENEFPNILTDNLKKANVDPTMMEQMGSMMEQANVNSMDDMLEGISKIPDPSIREAVENSMNEIVQLAGQNGYSGLYFSSVVMALLILVFVLILAPIRKKENKKEVAVK